MRKIADSLQAGNFCPHCQKGIIEGEEIFFCQNCGALNHIKCWETGGCGSYHCRARSDIGQGAKVDLVVSKDEVAKIVMPPRGRMHTTESLAREAAQQANQRTSVLSVIAFLSALGCFLGALKLSSSSGSIRESDLIPFLITLLGGIFSVVVSVFALASIQRDSQLKGNIPALAGLLIAAFSMALSLYSVSVRQNEGEEMAPVHFESGQVKDFVNKADPRIKGPLMTNVHISVGHGFMGEGQGSGVIVKVAGSIAYVLTNLHVLTSGKSVADLETLKKVAKPYLTFYSGEKKVAEPVWLAPSGIDIVLLKVTPPEGFASKCKIQPDRLVAIGQKVFAIGNPMGLNWSYTEGVISGLRSQQFGSHEMTVIQMQTPLNPGNSGGGLYDQEGFLVGINTWIYAKSVSEGLNFSIAIDGVFKVMDPGFIQLISGDSGTLEKGGKNVGTAEAPPGGLQQNR